MTYRGHVENGNVVLDESASLPEGAEVRIELVEYAAQASSVDQNQQPTLGQKLMKYAGKAAGLPPDAASNHDHYLYRTSKK